jgi:hypothetical protein
MTQMKETGRRRRKTTAVLPFPAWFPTSHGSSHHNSPLLRKPFPPEPSAAHSGRLARRTVLR